MSAKIIAVTNQKGGVGKTTTAVNLAYFLAKEQKARVLIVDFDPQGNATSGLGIDKTQLKSATNTDGEPTILDAISGEANLNNVIQPTNFKRLFIVPANPQLADAESGLAKAERRFIRLRDALNSLPAEGEEAYDFILIDSPPSLSLLTVNALVAANHVLLPVQAEFYALEGLGQLLETMKLVRKGLNPTLELLGVLVTMYDSRTTLSQEVYKEVAKHFPGKVFDIKIPRNVRLAEAPSHGLPVGAYDRFSKGSRAYKSAVEEIIKRIG
ncbi:ParA family protein [Candidatus Saccharibacteria bacterium]|nr:ParA family protein [Candidatus Saccharibacteria bacterium]